MMTMALKKRFELSVIESVMRLKQLKDLERVEDLDDGLYTHTNTRGRIRYIQICKSQTHARTVAEQTQGEYFKSFTSWVCLYEK